MASSGTKAVPSAQRDRRPTQFRTRSSQAASANFGGGGKGWEMGESATGLLLVASDLTPIYANAEAIQILAYPETSKPIGSLDVFLACKIRSVLIVNENDTQPTFATEFVSGRRRYACRAFSLDKSPTDHPALAVILERSRRTSFNAAQVATQFRLTPREQETLQYLMEGLTNKEIGHRMNISPNTVKAFLKLIMMKMGVSTRSGIIGKTVNPVLQRGSLLVASANHPYGE